MKKLNYDNLSSKNIIYIIDTLKRDNTSEECKEKVSLLVNALIDKYSKNKEDFNLYKIINDNLGYINDNDKTIDKIVSLFEVEFNNVENLNKDYVSINDFFNCFLNMFKIEKFKNPYLSKYETLLTYFDKFKLLKVSDPVIRQRINAFINEINNVVDEDLEADENSNENNKVKKVKEDKKVFKFLRSKVTHSEIENVLKNFSLFSKKDQIAILEVIAKKKWEDSLYQNRIHLYSVHINSILSVIDENRDIFKSYTKEIPVLNPVNFILTCLNCSRAYINKFYEYFNVSDFKDFAKVVGEWYLTFEGATENGKNIFIRSILWASKDNNLSTNSSLENLNNIDRYFLELACKDFRIFNDILSKYKNCSLSELQVKCDFDSSYLSPKGINLSWNGSKYIEKIKDNYSVEILDFVWSIFNTYNYRIFRNSCLELDKKSNKYLYLNDEFENLINEFFKIVETFKITKEDLKLRSRVVDYIKFNLNNYTLDKSLMKEIIFDESTFNDFVSCFNIFESKYKTTGCVSDKLLKEKRKLIALYGDIDFTKKEDFLAVIYMGILGYDAGDTFEYNGEEHEGIYFSILNGLEVLYPDVYNIIKYYYPEAISSSNKFKIQTANRVMSFIHDYFCNN